MRRYYQFVLEFDDTIEELEIGGKQQRSISFYDDLINVSINLRTLYLAEGLFSVNNNFFQNNDYDIEAIEPKRSVRELVTRRRSTDKETLDEYHKTVIQENPDEDFQPTTSRKRKSRETTPSSQSSQKRLKGKERAIYMQPSSFDFGETSRKNSEFHLSSVVETPTVDKRIMVIKATMKSIWNSTYTESLYIPIISNKIS